MNKTILDKINSPNDLKSLTIFDLKQLANELRDELLDVVSQNGGHLASSLGVVELTIALHQVFDTPKDKLVWDVGHQAYVHKILTGRKNNFKTLRQDDGCCGFLSQSESEYDAFGGGHAGTAISAALGMAVGRDLKKSSEKVVAIVGDGSLNCGISLEGLNNIVESTKDLIVILNDNKMSISENVGAIPQYLNRLIAGSSYNKIKNHIRTIVDKLPLGNKIHKIISRIEETLKSILVPGVFFEELGLRYLGPVDGHDIEGIIRNLNAAKSFNKPTLIHIITEKGKGYKPAELQPEKFHGLSSFDSKTGIVVKSNKSITFSSTFGLKAVKLAEKYDDIVAITAGMKSGTGLSEFADKFPNRFYDVGIAEEHALVFAAGLATQKIRPIVAIYASFLQRGLDCIFHDICLQNLPVIICSDRSGIVDDGPTHHGIHDVSFLRNMPNLSILSPKNECELMNMMDLAYEQNSPIVMRYPKGSTGNVNISEKLKILWGKAEVVENGNDIAIWAVGKEVYTALEVKKILAKNNIKASVINTRFIMPFDSELLAKFANKMPIITIEDCQISGGVGSIVDEILINIEHKGIKHFGWTNEIVPHGTVDGIREKFNLTSQQIAESTIKFLK